MRFKYHLYINQLPDCPPSRYEPQNRKAFRFVFADLDHTNNFLPVLLINPKRINSSGFKNNRAKCSGYGLSFFDTLENAVRRYRGLQRSSPNIHKSIGTHIAKGVITKQDGTVSEINNDGHFTLHEFEQANLRKSFSIVEKVNRDGKN